MEVMPASRTSDVIELSPYSNGSEVRVPQDYLLSPVFAAAKQFGPREVTVRVKVDGEIIERRYTMGGFHPLRRDHPPPALDVRHARAIFTLLSFQEPYKDTRLIKFSFNDFCRRYATANGGRYARAIKEILADLTDSYIRVVDVKRNEGHTYRLIEELDIKDKPIRKKNAALASSNQRELWFNGCTLTAEFYALLTRYAELQCLKLKVFTSIRSPLAQAIYLYIPSRATHHSETKPFEIRITTLLDQVSFPVPNYKSFRHKLFTQNRKSIIQQLDGVETLTGIFRVKLAETVDGTDWKLLAWVEKVVRKGKANKENSKLLDAYLKSGRPRELFDRAMEKIPALSVYELELIEKGGIDLPKCRRFLEMAKALLKESRLDELLAEAKNDEQEGRKAIKTSTHRLIHRIMEAIETPPITTAPAASARN